MHTAGTGRACSSSAHSKGAAPMPHRAGSRLPAQVTAGADGGLRVPRLRESDLGNTGTINTGIRVSSSCTPALVRGKLEKGTSLGNRQRVADGIPPTSAQRRLRESDEVTGARDRGLLTIFRNDPICSCELVLRSGSLTC